MKDLYKVNGIECSTRMEAENEVKKHSEKPTVIKKQFFNGKEVNRNIPVKGHAFNYTIH